MTTCVIPLRSRKSMKSKIAEIAAAVDPSHEHGFFAGIGGAQFAAHMSTL